ncbi:Nramp family divalent metal transporter [Sphingobacterium sp. SRCM116780]|uniref:Nramp family divalent metal transporter n=1 Tax=Sphingobacterium sp. SRCM116780 TaxID=2907623 RepID=UPI001F41E202|nr:Nramp family divalent metal transporter [Sphingobacterium sp. SRCM116780]UIR57062.1 Nramp family divalent metal transporter [Sphingobacterium sp. SRCM116780]
MNKDPYHHEKSLSDVHESVEISKGTSKLKRALSFFGPAYLISVGYMDPGNWATDLAGGSQFGYALLWVLLMSNIMALLLQSLCTRLGIVRRRDLAQCNRETYPRRMNFVLYILAEIAIAACDLAEVLGMAIGLNLLFGIDILWGVLISFADTFLIMYLQKLGMRKMELFIIGLVSMIGMCFMIEMFLVQPDFSEVVTGFIPSLPNSAALYIAIGIIGATVMPHNLYLHSALVQTRKIDRDEHSIKKALKYNFFDSAIALNLAFLVNAAILILASAAFHKNGMHNVAELEDAYHLLGKTLGNDLAPKLFAVALILAGQSSTVTGTLAGQIVMEGYLRLRISPTLRRIITRLLAIIPAVLVILIAGESEVGSLLIFSQVILSMQLAFAVIPLIHFVSDKKKMGNFAIKPYLQVLAWLIAIVIAVLNIKLVYEEISKWIVKYDQWWLTILLIAGAVGMVVLLVMTVLYPILHKNKRAVLSVHPPFEELVFEEPKVFNKVVLALDYSASDTKTVQYALSIANKNSHFILVHIVESATVKYTGESTDDLESRQDLARLKKYAHFFSDRDYQVDFELGYNNRVMSIAKICEQYQADLLIVGSHGHTGVKDFVFGETVNKLRHAVKIPVFIAQ